MIPRPETVFVGLGDSAVGKVPTLLTWGFELETQNLCTKGKYIHIIVITVLGEKKQVYIWIYWPAKID